jgi:hypothetical protein
MKWILGIVLGLVALAALAAAGYLAFSRWSGVGWMMDARAFRLWDGGRALLWRWTPMHPTWGIPASRFFGFSPLGMIAGGLIWLGLLALIVLGVIALARGLSRSSGSAVTSVQATSPAKACPNCGRPVQDDWSHCPYCGHALADDMGSDPPQA